MTRKHISKCKLCGNLSKLTYEHIPPKSVGNNKAIKAIPISNLLGDDKIKSVPIDLSSYKYISMQKGFGEYYLCSQCNNKTGEWYVPYYKDFIEQIKKQIQVNVRRGGMVKVKLNHIRPLAIVKEIYSMFVCINDNCNIHFPKNEILNMDEKIIDSKIKIYIHYDIGTVNKSIPFQGKMKLSFTGNADASIEFVSEIVFDNVGLRLVYDSPKQSETINNEISHFGTFDYKDEIDICLDIPILESHTFGGGDYRKMQEINETIKLAENIYKK